MTTRSMTTTIRPFSQFAAKSLFSFPSSSTDVKLRPRITTTDAAAVLCSRPTRRLHTHYPSTQLKFPYSTSPTIMTRREDRFLLPLDFSPKKYSLRLEPNLQNFTFEGVVEIQVEMLKAADSITLNCADIKVHKAHFTTASGKVFNTSDISFVEKDERVVFKFGSQLTESGTLHIEYQGELNDKMKGFYRSVYTWKGEKRFMATTQFEANDARRAFPCWDEPDRKALFEVELIVDRHLTALSNMNAISTHSDPDTGKKVVKFATSPLMPTYLVAFCIGEYDYIESTVQMEKGPLILRVYTVPGKTHLAKYALEVGSKVLPNLEKFFGIPFPFPKMDMIAIPEFSAGAMENIGLITYRETALLYDEKNSTLSTKQWICLVVSHELGHSFYGNYVTMEWWDALWLNEGGAVFIEYVLTNELYPEWEIFNQFVQLDVGNALILDSMESSHPIQVPCKRAEEVDEIFDAISYNKACAVIYMLSNYITLDAFKKALNIYMKRFAWKNAQPQDLWDAMTEVVGTDIAQLMTGWTDQTGYPVIEVHPAKDSNGKRALRVKQRRFLQRGPSDDKTQWRVPISYITDKSSTPQYFLLTQEEDIITVPENAKFIKLNGKQTGFYRVQYADEMLPSLVDAIRTQEISAIDRLGILQDFCALAKAGYTDAKQALTIFSAFETEEDYIVVKALATNVLSFYGIIKRNPSIEPLFKEFGHGIFDRLGRKFGWHAKEGETDLDALTRTTVLGILKKLEHPETIKTGMEKFRAIAQEEKSDVVSPDLLGLVYAIGLSEGGKEEYDAVLNIFRKTDLNEERVRVLGSLGATKDEELLKSILKEEFVLDEVKAQDLMYPISSVVGNKKGGREKVWDWFVTNFDSIKRRVDNGFLFGRILKTAASEFDTEEHRKKVEDFLKTKELPQLKRSIAQVLEGIELSAATRERIEGSITPDSLKKLIEDQKKQ